MKHRYKIFVYDADYKVLEHYNDDSIPDVKNVFGSIEECISEINSFGAIITRKKFADGPIVKILKDMILIRSDHPLFNIEILDRILYKLFDDYDTIVRQRFEKMVLKTIKI